MNKNAIKKFAIWARRELIDRVTQRAMKYGFTEENVDQLTPEIFDQDIVNGHIISDTEKEQCKALLSHIQADGFPQAIEEAAYTWFNRFAALRFMEVNGYLPSHVRVFTNDNGEFKPQILAEAIHLDLDGLDKNKVYDLENASNSDELFKYLLIVQCNALNAILPGMFQEIKDYTELLFPDNQLREGSVIEQMITTIPEEDWTDQVQIIGWLYEAYNTELNSLVYDGTLSKAKIPKELVPAATTIFTPDWPVHYMVENSLGRLWMEGHPNSTLRTKWKYYLEEAEQESETQKQLVKVREQYSSLKPENILVIDPCVGSGHILCVLFDILVQIYEDYGHSSREAAIKIVENNLWGLDINNRAVQLAYFAIMMKARQYNRRIFDTGVQPHIYAIQDSNNINRDHLESLGHSINNADRDIAIKQINSLLDKFIDASEYGSILQLQEFDWALLSLFVEDTKRDQQMTLDESELDKTQKKLKSIIAQGQALAQKYHIVITNPPYLGSNRFDVKLDSYVKANWSHAKSDLSMVMYQHAIDDMVLPNGFVSFITTTSWMFLSSFEKLRYHIINIGTLSSLIDFGTELFDGKVGHNPIVSWVIRKSAVSNYKFTAIRLVDFCYAKRGKKETEFLSGRNRYISQQTNFAKIPGAPLAYWVSDAMVHAFDSPKLSEILEPKQGTSTGDNNIFLRLWFEVSFHDIKFNHVNGTNCIKKWYPATKGGDFRKWYGNNEYIVDWQDNGKRIKECKSSAIRNAGDNFKEALTWTGISSKALGIRFCPRGFVFLISGKGIVGNVNKLKYILACCCSTVVNNLLRITSPTLSFEVGYIAGIPIKFDMHRKELIDKLTDNCIFLSHVDWDSFETSWDFARHPLIRNVPTIKEAYEQWAEECDQRFRQLKANEEELNRIFIDIYGLQDELTPEVEDKDVTVRKADLQRDVRSFISYAVGCMFGRYSLDVPGLAYAGGDWDASKYKTFQPDNDNIIPICDDEYFEDDIVGRFVKFVETVFGKKTLEENLSFIASALRSSASSLLPRQVLRNYFVNDFYEDHLKIYQKRPIYWLFDSGKKNGFKCLVYMHRYEPDVLARIRTDYIHEQQSRFRTAIADLEQRISDASASERIKLSKQLAIIKAQAEEIRLYEEKIHHLADQMISIDLDDGVKANYAKFADVLAKIK